MTLHLRQQEDMHLLLILQGVFGNRVHHINISFLGRQRHLISPEFAVMTHLTPLH